MNPLLRLKSSRRPLSRPECALALLVVGVRLTVFAYAGSPLPYYDQWLAEFHNMFGGIATGQNFMALMDYHNEHWLVTTKLLSLLGFLLNGYWDVSFLIVCSALVRALTAAWTFRLITLDRDRSPLQKKSLWLLCCVFFAFPFSGYNLLSGLQVSFFLADCALLWSLHTLIRWEKAAPSGLSLVGAMAFGIASMGSAVAIPAATLIAHLCQRRSRPGFWFAWGITALLALVYIIVTLSTLTAPSSHADKHWPAIFCLWLQILAWPTNLVGVGALVATATVYLLVRIRRHKPDQNSLFPVLAGLGVYAGTNAAMIAVARPPGTLHMRQWDTIGWIAFAVLALTLHVGTKLKWPRTALVVSGATACLYLSGLMQIFRSITFPYYQAAHATRTTALAHYRELLLNGDLRAEAARVDSLLKKNSLLFFDDPIGRHDLHPIVLHYLAGNQRRPLALLAPEIIPARQPSRLSRTLRVVIDWAWVLAVGGLALGMISLIRNSRPSPAPIRSVHL